MVDLLERLDVLIQQELSSYKTEDYLAPPFQYRLLLSQNPDDSCQGILDTSSLSSSSGSSSVSGINEFWREKICEWSYQVIDHFDFSREVVSISIHYLDRYLATRPVNKKIFQLVAMTTLFIAIKIYEPGKVSMSTMIELSRGYFLVEQMTAMEMEILRALKWQVHPPTAYCFSKHFLFLLPYTSIDMNTRQDILELARFLTELSVIDYFFVPHRPSSVALGALHLAMKEIPTVSEEARRDFARELARVSRLDLSDPDVLECRSRIHQLYAQGGYSRPSEARVRSDESAEVRDEAISPVCVSYGVNPHAGAPVSRTSTTGEKGERC